MTALTSYLLLLTLTINLHYSSAIVVYLITANTPRNATYAATSLTAYYSTLGAFPSAPVIANLSLLSSSDVSSAGCALLKNVSGMVVVYDDKDLPDMHGCNHDPLGKSAALARTVEQYGGVGLILFAAETVGITRY